MKTEELLKLLTEVDLDEVEILKKGNKIHIKPSRRGSFTRWCGGKVTEECIRRGKNSGDPRIVRKATFAQNFRHKGKGK